MHHPRRLFAVAILMAFAGGQTGCSSLQSTHSGFLDDDAQLKPIVGAKGSSEFRRAGVDWRKVTRLVVAPVELRLAAARQKRFSADDLEMVRSEADTILRETLAKRFELVETPLPDCAVLRFAITDIDDVNVGVNALTTIIAVPLDNGGVSAELEFVDATTRERLYAFAGYRTGKVTQVAGFFQRLGHARNALKAISQFVLMRIDTQEKEPATDGK